MNARARPKQRFQPPGVFIRSERMGKMDEMPQELRLAGGTTELSARLKQEQRKPSQLLPFASTSTGIWLSFS